MPDLLLPVASAFLDHILLPTLAWTAVAWPALAALRHVRRLRPEAHYALRRALALALPLAVLASLVDVTAPLGLPAASFVLPGIEATPDAAGAPDWSLAHVLGALALAALMASAAALLRLAAQVRSVARLRAGLRSDAPPAALRMARALAADLGIRRTVRLARLEAGHVPFTAGVLHPVVALPAPLFADASRLRMTLLHELVHVRRLDALRALADAVLAALWCWHPLVHRLRAELACFREETCDAAVLRAPSVRRRAYATLLLELSAPPSPAALAPAAALGMASLDAHLKPRLEAMTRFSATPHRALPSLLASLFLLLGTLGLAACTDTVSDAPPAPTAEIQTEAIKGEAVQDLDAMPRIVGGIAAVQEQIVYPQPAKTAGLEGRVLVQFVVDVEGVPRDVEIVEGLGGGLDEEARRAVEAVRFTPGEKDGVRVPVALVLPITFRLPEGDA